MPNPEMRNRPAGYGTADRRADFNNPEEITEPTTDIQVRSLRHHFALGHYLETVVANLAWGALPR